MDDEDEDTMDFFDSKGVKAAEKQQGSDHGNGVEIGSEVGSEHSSLASSFAMPRFSKEYHVASPTPTTSSISSTAQLVKKDPPASKNMKTDAKAAAAKPSKRKK